MKKRKGFKKVLAVQGILLGILVIAWGIIWHYHSSPEGYIEMDTNNPLIVGETLLCAHRSGGGVYPEESLPAFRNCAESEDFHTDYFEFDLHLTKDNHLVLMHDDSLDRTTDSSIVFGKNGTVVREKTLEELKMLNIGAKFVTEDGEMPYSIYSGTDVPDDLRILTLEEALDYLTGIDDYHYIIEIKDGGEDGRQSADILYAELKARGLLDSALICSFDDDILAYVDSRYPDAKRGAGVSEALAFVGAAVLRDEDYVARCDAVQLPYGDPKESKGLNLGLVSFVNYAHAHDIAVQYWTINDVEDMKYLRSIHVDVIMTDYPEKLAEILD